MHLLGGSGYVYLFIVIKLGCEDQKRSSLVSNNLMFWAVTILSGKLFHITTTLWVEGLSLALGFITLKLWPLSIHRPMILFALLILMFMC